jgi:YHS domain-containing protein
VPGPVDLFQVRSTSTPQPRKQVDPVCRMELALSEVAARVRIGATDHVFCSTDCLQRFVAAPDDYVSPA